MTDKKILSLVRNFRKKVDRAQSKGLFVDTMLENFPIQCCGTISTLLAEFLRDNGVETLWISAEEFSTRETHAWLVVKDNRIDSPRSCFYDIPNNIINLLDTYSARSQEHIRKVTHYEEQNIKNGLLVDITGDQFNEVPIYVGYMDSFHKQFTFIGAFEYEGLLNEEHDKLYKIIIQQ